MRKARRSQQPNNSHRPKSVQSLLDWERTSRMAVEAALEDCRRTIDNPNESKPRGLLAANRERLAARSKVRTLLAANREWLAARSACARHVRALAAADLLR